MRLQGLALGDAVLDAGGSHPAVGTVEDHLRRLGAGDDRQVRALLRLAGDERPISARPPAVARRVLGQRHDASGATAVAAVVVALWDAGRDGRLDELPGGR